MLLPLPLIIKHANLIKSETFCNIYFHKLKFMRHEILVKMLTNVLNNLLLLLYIPLLLISATVFLNQVDYRTQTLIGDIHMGITLNLSVVEFARA